MLVFVSQGEMIARIQNLMQMEGLYYYRNTAVHPFKLKEAYTFIESEVEAELNNFMPVPELTDKSIFKVTRNQFRGY